MRLELTKKGERYLERIPDAIARLLEKPTDPKKRLRTSQFYKLTLRDKLLRKVREEVDLLEEPYAYLGEDARSIRAIETIRREMGKMWREGLFYYAEDDPADYFMLIRAEKVKK